jgi:hypothetical protein
MDPFTGYALVAGGSALASGIGNWLANSSANDRAQAILDRNFRDWMGINIPDPAQQKIALQQFVQQGTLSPVMEKAIKADPSAFESITSNPKYAGAQNRALSELEDIGYSGGLRLQDKAALQDAMMDSQTRDKANRQGVLDEMGRRGTLGGGLELAARLEGQSANQDRLGNQSLKIAADAQDRALKSIMGAGEMATNLRGQDFDEAGKKASAADRINMFNTENLRDVNQRNTAMTNRAAELNLGEKQRISDQNTGLANSQQMYNKGLAQQQYENQLKRMAGATGQYGKAAETESAGGKNLGNAISNIGGGVSNAATSAGQMAFWDDYFKKKKLEDGSAFNNASNGTSKTWG